MKEFKTHLDRFWLALTPRPDEGERWAKHEIESLRQQLAKAQTQSARRLEGLCKCGVENDQLRKQVGLLMDFIEGIANSTPSDDTDGAPSEAWEFLEKFDKGPKL